MSTHPPCAWSPQLAAFLPRQVGTPISKGQHKFAYDPARYMDVEDVDQAIEVILNPTEGMTAQQRWSDETPALMRIIERHVYPKSTVLDYGCGIGRLAKPLIQKLDCKVVGVDISSCMRALAGGTSSFYTLDPAMFYTIRPDSFDAAISVWALQHCLDLQEAIDRISNVLMIGAKFIVVNNKGLRSLPIENGEWADDGQDIEKMITEVGFSEVENGRLDESVAPGWMQDGTFWAVYQKVQ
jgi:SAM-dependent methyltransferase